MINKLSDFRKITAMGQLRLDLMAASFVLLMATSVFEGFSFGLLVPFLKQASGLGAYEGWKAIPFLGDILLTFHFESIANRIDLILCVIVSAVVLRQVFSYTSQVLFYSATSIFESKLRISGYETLLNYGCSFFDGVKKGQMQNTLMRFTQEVADLMRETFGLLQNMFFLIIYIIVLLSISVSLSLTALAIAPVFYFLLRTLFKTIHQLYKRILQQEQKSHGLSLDVFSNIKLVKAMGKEKDEAVNFRRQESGRARDNILAYSLYLLISPLQEILTTVGIGVIIWVSFAYYFKDDPSFLIKLIVSLLLFRRALGVLNSIFSNYPQVIRRLPFVREYQELMDVSMKGVVISGRKTFDQLGQSIEYRNVSMGYSKDQEVLKDISFVVPAGSFTAIVGASGTGKSTLVELLPRFYEYQSGEILIDDISIRQFSVESLRQSVGFVSQDTLVLNDTIFNNILYAKSGATNEEVFDAAEKANVTPFVRKLPDGFQTPIGDKGVKLSGGELQRLAIARVILRKPKILILDEATSALDSVSEQMIQAALNNLTKNRTTIAIAHRLSTVRNADQILVMDQGRIIERGTHEELLRARGLFYRYWQAQMV